MSDDNAQFRVIKKNTDGSGDDTELMIDREDDGEIRLVILEGPYDAGQITLSAEQVAALRQWLVP